MAVLVAGLVPGYRRTHTTHPDCAGRSWKFNACVANPRGFLRMGVTISVGMFEERWLTRLTGIAGVFSARAIGILTLVPVLNKAIPRADINRPLQIVILWGGLCGAVTLALSLLTALENPVNRLWCSAVHAVCTGDNHVTLVRYYQAAARPNAPALRYMRCRPVPLPRASGSFRFLLVRRVSHVIGAPVRHEAALSPDCNAVAVLERHPVNLTLVLPPVDSLNPPVCQHALPQNVTVTGVSSAGLCVTR